SARRTTPRASLLPRNGRAIIAAHRSGATFSWQPAGDTAHSSRAHAAKATRRHRTLPRHRQSATRRTRCGQSALYSTMDAVLQDEERDVAGREQARQVTAGRRINIPHFWGWFAFAIFAV